MSAVSRQLPSFLQTQLRVGSSAENPLLRAVDRSIDYVLDIAFEEAFRIHPDYWNTERRNALLCGLGFDANDREATQIMSSLRLLFQRRGTMDAVDELAGVYFGEVRIVRGRPESSIQLDHAFRRVQLCDRSALNQTLWVYPSQYPASDVIQRFRNSVKRFVPEDFSVEVAERILVPPRPNPVSFSKGLFLRKERLTDVTFFRAQDPAHR